jgi:hypothetical protein
MYGKASLAHTCRSMHHHLRLVCLRTWTELSQQERLDFLWEMLCKWPLSNDYVCSSCCKLHPLDKDDVPYKPLLLSPRTCPGSTTRNSFNEYYRLEQHHIALALKWAQFPFYHENRKKHLKTLLTPYTINAPKNSNYLIRFEASPVVSRGTFVLFTRWDFTRMPQAPNATPSIETYRLCPHLKYTSDFMIRANPSPDLREITNDLM